MTAGETRSLQVGRALGIPLLLRCPEPDVFQADGVAWHWFRVRALA